MATYKVSMLNGNTIPDATGRCWAETYDIVATNDVWKPAVFRFKDPTSGQTHGIHGSFQVPSNYASTVTVVPVWTATATSGNVSWNLDARVVGGDDTTSLDQAGVQETVSVLDAAPTAANRRLTPTITPTSANYSAGSTVEFWFYRSDSSATDTMAADSILFALEFSYSDV